MTTSQKRIWVSVLSVLISTFLMVSKFFAANITGSRAIYSDALESVVNVTAAVTALGVMIYAVKPADEDHPYGHGKIEYFSAVFEGGLLTFAGVMILIEAVGAFLTHRHLRQLDFGLAITCATGIANLLLGVSLRKFGKELQSIALQASGSHVISDFWTTLAVVGGLVLAKLTGFTILDPILAVAVAAHLIRTGFLIVKESSGGLLDAEDRNVIQELSALFRKKSFPGIIRIHATRVIRSGEYHHIDAHVVVPEFWTVEQAHDETNRFEQRVINEYRTRGEIHFHVDPCRRAYCEVCDLKECPIRQEPFKTRGTFSVEELISPTEPKKYRISKEDYTS